MKRFILGKSLNTGHSVRKEERERGQQKEKKEKENGDYMQNQSESRYQQYQCN